MAYTILFTNNAYRKFRGYIDLVENEVSGMAKIEHDEYTDQIIISDLILLPQTVSPALTTMDRDGLDKWLLDCMDKGIDTSKYRCWWHSHAKMDVFWSGTDERTIQDWDNEQNVDNYFVSVVGNHKGEIKARIDVFAPIHYTIQDVPVEVQALDDGLIDELEKEVKEKVKTPVTTPVIYGMDNKPLKRDNSLKPVMKGKTDQLEVVPIPDQEPAGLGNIPEYLEEEETQKKIQRLPEMDQMKGFYWREYLLGNWDDVGLEEVTQYGDLRLFQRTEKNGKALYIPKAPECKWYRQMIMSEVGDLGGLN